MADKRPGASNAAWGNISVAGICPGRLAASTSPPVNDTVGARYKRGHLISRTDALRQGARERPSIALNNKLTGRLNHVSITF